MFDQNVNLQTAPNNSNLAGNGSDLTAAHLPEIDRFRLPGLPEPTAQRKEQVGFFASQGFQFVLLAKEGKSPILRDWPNKPERADRAARHYGNIGVMAGKDSDNIVWIDLDTNAKELLAMFPQLGNSLIVWRDNAPDRLKIAVRVDRLPRSTKWRKNPKQRKPDIELLSTGNQAVVIGTHESGAVIRNNSKAPVQMTFGELSAIWRRWTGEELPDPTVTTDRRLTANAAALGSVKPSHSDNSIANRVKALWGPLAVFEHHSVGGDRVDEGAGVVRILGNGGLLVDTVRGLWYTFADSVGGDAITAWAWCKHGSTELSAAQFVAVCREMLAAKGESLPERPTYDWAAMIERYSQPERYPAGRTNTFDRGCMLAILGIMAGANKSDVKVSTRQLGEIAGCGAVTACKAIHRLIEQQKIQRSDLLSWHSNATFDDSDSQIVNQFDAYSYRLTDSTIAELNVLLELDTVQSTSALVLRTVSSSNSCEISDTVDLDPHTLQVWAASDAFQWGAKVAETACRLGRGALDAIAALVVSNDQNTAEIAESTGRSRSGLSPVLNSLADLGLVEKYKEGRTVYWYLRDGWQDILQRYIVSLTTFCRTVKRRIRHLRERIFRAGCALGKAESGLLRARLCEMLENWQRRLLVLRDELTRLVAMKTA